MYRIPVVWSMTATVEVMAKSFEDAVEAVEDGPLPTDGSYLEGSFSVDHSGDVNSVFQI